MGQLLTGKIAKIVIYDKGRVNGGTDFNSPEPGFVPKPVFNILGKRFLGKNKLQNQKIKMRFFKILRTTSGTSASEVILSMY